jgi:S-adenosylmethionine:tRNA ribosyltransferase-isomerase
LAGAGAEAGPDGLIHGTTEIFITPGYCFRAVDVLLTNFHLPRSTVLALAMAFAGPERIRAAYRDAIESGYRFFSFGDAMLIEPVVRACEDRGALEEGDFQ